MAGATPTGATRIAARIWIGPIVGAALLFVAPRAIPAQSGQTRFLPYPSSIPGSLAGKLTDLHSKPLAGVVVILRNESTSAEIRTRTAKNGTYRFTGLAPGEYTLEADSTQLGRSRLEGIVIYAGREARVQTAMRFESPAPAALTPAPPQAARELQTARTMLPRSTRSLPSPSPVFTSALSSPLKHALFPSAIPHHSQRRCPPNLCSRWPCPLSPCPPA